MLPTARPPPAFVHAQINGSACDSLPRPHTRRYSHVVRLSPGSRQAPDTHLDASATTFRADFLAGGVRQQPDWVVTSPPYKGAMKFVTAALSVAKKGVALKLSLSFLEPCADRGEWLSANPPALCVLLRRGKYTPAPVNVGEFWGVWYCTCADTTTAGGSKLVFCP